ncbi:MAG: ferrochelatase, partial [Terriglobales bacterium]
MAYDAVLLVSFGGPERREDVLPFLDNVLRGRTVPAARRLAVAEHYYRFDGRSPLPAANRALQAALRQALEGCGIKLPVYLGNRNWRPLLADTLLEMTAAGVTSALAVVTSAFGSYSSCRQYLEDIARARAEAGTRAPGVEKIRLFYNHPRFIEIWAE